MPLNKPGEQLYLRGMPKAVKDKFKLHCVKRGLSMKDKLVELMRDWIKKEESS